ncbi:MAG TPA: OpgC domain-containing protein, partial [Humisphaera sp.]
LPRARDPDRRRATYKALWRRSAVILFVHYLAEIGYLAMWPLLGGVAADDVRGRIWHVLTLRSGYDLLPFYVVMMLLAPLMLELLRRGLWWVLAAASVGAFAWGQFHDPWVLSLPIRHDFPPILWQLFFVAGVIGGAWLPAYDRLPRPVKVQVGTAFVTSFAILFASCYAHDLGLYPFLPLTFAKLPLSTGEALRYFALVGSILVFTDLYWRRGDGGGSAAGRRFGIDGSPVARFCQRLGRNSLPVYVFHAWVVQAMHRVHANHWGGPEGTWQLWTAVAAVAAVWAFAWGLEAWHAWRERVEAREAEARKAEAAATRRPERRGPLSLPGVRPAVSACLVLVAVVLSNRVARVVAPQRHHARQAQIDGPSDFGGAPYVGDYLDELDRADPVTPADEEPEKE